MASEIVVHENPVIVRPHKNGRNESEERKKSSKVIDAKYKVIRDPRPKSHFDRNKVRRIPGQVGSVVKEVGKTIWGYTVGHESNVGSSLSIGSASSAQKNTRVFHSDDVIARRSSQITDTTGPFWSSNSLGNGKSPLDQTIGQSFNWGLQSPRKQNMPSRYSKKRFGGRTWKKRR